MGNQYYIVVFNLNFLRIDVLEFLGLCFLATAGSLSESQFFWPVSVLQCLPFKNTDLKILNTPINIKNQILYISWICTLDLVLGFQLFRTPWLVFSLSLACLLLNRDIYLLSVYGS